MSAVTEFGRLVGVHRDQDAPFGVVGDERARRLGEHPEPVPDHVGHVVGAAALARAVQQPPASAPPPARAGRPPRAASRRAGPRVRPRRWPAGGSAGSRPGCTRRGRPPRRRPGSARRARSGRGRDRRGPGRRRSRGQAGPRPALRPAAGHRRRCAARRTRPPAARPACPCRRRAERAAAASRRSPHSPGRSAGMTISRFWILPVGPLGSASTIHTWRGYLYAATWPLT